MALFDRLDRMVSRTTDRAFAHAFTLKPALRSPNGRPVADLDRPEVSFKGIFDERPVDDVLGKVAHTPVPGVRLELSVDTERYPALSGAKQGDRIESPTGESWEVASVRRDGDVRTVLVLVTS